MQSTAETWKPVVGYEGLYEVSSHGRVKSLKRFDSIGRLRPEKIMKLDSARLGYLRVELWADGEAKKHYVHRLVAVAFIGPRPTGKQVDHIDNSPSNNRPENLQYLTPKQNTNRQAIFGNACADRVARGTHNMTARTHCPQGHELSPENIKPSMFKKYGRRTCLACNRAQSYVYLHQELRPHLKELSDHYYEKIMKQSA